MNGPLSPPLRFRLSLPQRSHTGVCVVSSSKSNSAHAARLKEQNCGASSRAPCPCALRVSGLCPPPVFFPWPASPQPRLRLSKLRGHMPRTGPWDSVAAPSCLLLECTEPTQARPPRIASYPPMPGYNDAPVLSLLCGLILVGQLTGGRQAS